MKLLKKIFKKKQTIRTATEWVMLTENEEKRIAQRFLDRTLLGSTIEITVQHKETGAKLDAKAIIVAVEYPKESKECISSVIKEIDTIPPLLK